MENLTLKLRLTEITSINLETGQEWDYSKYPVVGFYFNTNPNDVAPYKMMIKYPSDSLIIFDKTQFNEFFELVEKKEDVEPSKNEPSLGFISENALLKAIAISQKPELIKEIQF